MLASPVVLSSAFVTILAVALYFVTCVNVGRMRYKHHVKAPAITGPLEFECAVRVQMNTLEQLPAFVILLWLATVFFSPYPLLAPLLGVVWLIGRVLFFVGYMQAPEKRAFGFMTSMLTELALLLLALTGVVLAFGATA
ncbi:glutathione S-transferase [Rhizomicrobium palustre]|uniref:Glutathione S-transferase n=1 Tax=Rhizomicrobium palustre TaxID=189966 RepID=A0A846N2K0_9PROT|nr:MAPEG family protein [Rhizomicrobium palustre]NIK89715.1 glutathione S-transferase [Rhizomicrobium palustre]